MTAAVAEQREPVEPGDHVTDGETPGYVLGVDVSPTGREDVYVLWLPNLPDEEGS